MHNAWLLLFSAISFRELLSSLHYINLIQGLQYFVVIIASLLFVKAGLLSISFRKQRTEDASADAFDRTKRANMR